MKTAKQLREEIASLVDRVSALMATAESEKRDLTADENAEIDAAHGTEQKAGRIATLEAEAKRAEKIEAKQAEYAVLRANGQSASAAVPSPGTQLPPSQGTNPGAGVRVIPAGGRYRSGTLKAFKGERAEERAYTAGRFLMATVFDHDASKRWCHDNNIDTRFRAAHQESANELGGFLVPEDVETAIIDLRESYGVFRREAKVTPMAGDVKIQPRRVAGLTAYFGGESASLTESQKAWDQVKLVTKKLYTLSRWSNELNEDAVISIGDDLTNETSYAFAVKEDQCGFVGDATSTYGGILGVTNALAAGSVVTAASTHTGFSTLTLPDFEGMIAALPNYVLNPKWFISQLGWALSMQRLMDAANGNTMLLLAAGAPKRFLGYEVVISQALPKLTGAQVSTPACLFGDLSMAALMGDRRGVSIKRSEDFFFSTDEIGIRGTERFDINVHERGTATVAGAMLMLQFAAS